MIGEDQFLLRDGLVRLLESSDFEIAAAVGSGPELLDAMVELRPDVSVVDIRVFDGDQFVDILREAFSALGW